MFILSKENKLDLSVIKENNDEVYKQLFELYNSMNRVMINLEEMDIIDAKSINLHLNREFNLIINDTHLRHCNYKYPISIHTKPKNKHYFNIKLIVQGGTYNLSVSVSNLKETMSVKTRLKTENELYQKIIS